MIDSMSSATVKRQRCDILGVQRTVSVVGKVALRVPTCGTKNVTFTWRAVLNRFLIGQRHPFAIGCR
jgi:hypothetical protein